jgi:hypothetical protein
MVRIAVIAICVIAAASIGVTILAPPLAASRGSRALGVMPRRRAFAISAGAPYVSPPPAAAPDLRSGPGVTAATSGVWTPLTNQPPFVASAGAYLLTDGRVLVEDATLTDIAWWTLSPDNSGSYINGTWRQVASPPDCPNGENPLDTVYAPLYYASAVLPDGRFVIVGGEYDYSYDYVRKGTGEVWTNQGAIYDPVANAWTCIAAPSGWKMIGDAQAVVLADGTFMVANPFNNQVAMLNAATNPPSFNSPFIPPGKAADPMNDEEGWTLLPNGDVLTLEIWNPNDNFDTPALTYSPVSKAWSSAGAAPDPLVNLDVDPQTKSRYDEIGPAMLRPDGTVFAAGATGNNDIYDTNGGTWSSGPVFPTVAGQQLEVGDGPAALLPDGNVLIAASPIYASPTEFFEFDGINLTPVAAPPNASGDASFQERMLLLPTGQVLFTDFSQTVEIYTPAGSPNASWAPTIASAPAQVVAGATNYNLSGTQFNGLSQAVAYGDDYSAATNYPLVRITNNSTGHVACARTHNHGTMAVATGNAPVSTEFDVPGGIETGASTLVVVANGIESSPVDVNVAPSPTPTATATATATATPTATPTPALLKVKPAAQNFGKVRVGHTRRATLTLKNQATSGPPVIFGSPMAAVPAAGQPDFESVGTNCGPQLPPRKKCELTVQFRPQSLGPKSSTITIFNNAANGNQTIPLSGTGK